MEPSVAAVPVADDAGLPEGVWKETLSEPTDCIARPRAGDEVHIHFRGFLPDGTEFHNTHLQSGDFQFTLGEGEINRGLDLGIATMCKGERAKFIVGPEFAYGDGVPGKIPPQATLTFEVELLWWRRTNSLTSDGGVVKVVQVEGTGFKKPYPGWTIKLRYAGYVEGAEFTRSPADGVEANVSGPNPLELPEKTWQLVVTSMSQHEKATVTLTPQYGYDGTSAFESKVPRNSTVTLELELLDVFLVKDCGLFQRCGEKNFPRLMKRQQMDGDASKKPNNLSQISAVVNGKQVMWELIAGQRCEAVECAVLSMFKGEKCVVVAEDPAMCQDDELGLCPSSGPVEIEVELIDFQRTPDTWDLLPMHRVEKGKRLKQRGADFMKAKDFRRACWVYRSVQDMMGYVDDWPEELRSAGDELRQTCRSNEVMAWLKLEQFRDVVDLCTEILNGGGISSPDPGNVKALFRRGVAYLSVGEPEKAKHDFLSVLEHEPQNAEAKQQLARVRSSEKDQARKSQSLMRGMISEAGKLDYPVGYTTAEGDRERQRDAMLDKVDQIKAQMPLTL